MVNITAYTSQPDTRLASTPASAASPAPLLPAQDKPATGGPDTRSDLSPAARQLSEAATRAEARDASLGRKALGEKAATLLGQITGDKYFANKAQHNVEVPNTDAPDLLARARQTTGFVNGSDSNPFKGLPRDQLALITYDDSGTYTVNERRAAWEEASSQEETWRKGVVANAMAEYDSTGKLTGFFSSVLDHFKSLSAIEQAQYPDDYASGLQQKIDLDFNYKTHQAEGKGAGAEEVVAQWLGAGPQDVALNR